MAPQTWPLLMDSGLCHEPQVGGDLGTCPLPQTPPGLALPPPYPQAEVALWSLLFSPEG